jgi:predicted Zn finger-like uncharacterized protein
MIVRCPDCQAKYEIATSMVPQTGIKVRCPKCKAVFPIDAKPTSRTGAPREAPALAAVTAPRTDSGMEHQRNGPHVNRMPDPNEDMPADDRPQRPARLVTDPVIARRMARAVIHEVLLGRDETERREAVARGAALSVFGGEIAGAFDVFMRKISPEMNSAPSIFREAVNDILGGGEALL